MVLGSQGQRLYWEMGRNQRICHQHHIDYNLQLYPKFLQHYWVHVPEEYLIGWAYSCAHPVAMPGLKRGEECLATLAFLRERVLPIPNTASGISQKREGSAQRKLGSRAGSQKTTDVPFSVHLLPRLKVFITGTVGFHLRISDTQCLALHSCLIDVFFVCLFFKETAH